MLDPRSRGALLEALRPPAGYIVESALATTYSLDLITLLTAPLAFSLYDRLAAQEGNKGPERLDSFALLHAVRQHAERLVVFCQSGCIAKPKGYRQLLAYLESTVVQVMAPSEAGAFHPKVWVQRFVSTVADVEEPVRYRVLCLSRNLTFDRSWDTMLAIDGVLVDRKLAISESKPFAEFIESLPAMAVDATGALTAVQREIVATMTDELRRVRFEVPEGFESMRFWPLGHDGKRRDPFGDTRVERLLVVSPFLSSGRLETLTKKGKGHVLVSSLHELETIPKKVLDLYSEVHVLNDAAEDPEEDGADTDAEDIASVGPVPPARGLHAKLYVADDGWKAHVWTGSSNASHGGFELNVELLVQLTGKKKDTGVDRILDGEGKAGGLRMLLHRFIPPDQPVEPTDLEKQVDEIVRVASRALAKAHWSARVTRADADGKETYRVELALRDGALDLPPDCAVRAWPISLSEQRARPLEGAWPKATFNRCSMQALSAFFAFEISVNVGAVPSTCVFVLRVPLEGAPADRAARILHTLLDEPAKVLRFLRLLLSADAFEALGLLDPPTGPDGAPEAQGAGTTADDTVPLFESLVRTLDREPERLVEVDRLVRELRSTVDGARLLPPSFDEVWTPLWAAYETLRADATRATGKRSR